MRMRKRERVRENCWCVVQCDKKSRMMHWRCRRCLNDQLPKYAQVNFIYISMSNANTLDNMLRGIDSNTSRKTQQKSSADCVRVYVFSFLSGCQPPSLWWRYLCEPLLFVPSMCSSDNDKRCTMCTCLLDASKRIEHFSLSARQTQNFVFSKHWFVEQRGAHTGMMIARLTGTE